MSLRNLAILHYHFQPGGVTRVVSNHLQALEATATEALNVFLLHDGQQAGLPADLDADFQHLRVQHIVDGAFGYDSRHRAGGGDVARVVGDALGTAGCRTDDTVLHVHNHALGKNAALTAALPRLAGEGWRMLLHMHDFAEDFRPVEFSHLSQQLPHDQWYPQAPQIHYGTLNRRDRSLLQAAGVPEERLHLMPNPVLPDPPGDRAAGRAALAGRFGALWREQYNLYPVRGIARKQVGEFLLHALLGDEEQCFGISLAPANPWQQPTYDRWVGIARQLELPVLFESGATDGLSFADHIAAADRIVSTSIAEGFGMAFLESCLSGHLIIGRDLPEITADFTDEGLQFPGLRPRFPVPVDWLGREDWQRELVTAYGQVLEAYQQPRPSAGSLGEICGGLVRDGLVDLATCTTRLQEQLVFTAASDPQRREELARLNPPPLRMHSAAKLEHIAENNRQMVGNSYSMGAIGKRLRTCYDELLDATAERVELLAETAVIIQGFLAIDRFAPVRILAA